MNKSYLVDYTKWKIIISFSLQSLFFLSFVVLKKSTFTYLSKAKAKGQYGCGCLIFEECSYCPPMIQVKVSCSLLKDVPFHYDASEDNRRDVEVCIN